DAEGRPRVRTFGSRYPAPSGRAARVWFHHIIEVSPARVVLFVFVILTALFTALLMLPHASATGEATAFTDAFFTAVSGISVTGLSTVDMGNHWSLFGEVLVLLSLQIG